MTLVLLCAGLAAAAGAALDRWLRYAAAREADDPAAGRVPLDRHLRTRAGAAAVPVLAAALAAVVASRAGGRWTLLPLLLLAVLLAELVVVDVATRRLPNAVTLPAYPLGIVAVGAAAAAEGEPRMLLGGVLGGGLLLGGYLLVALAVPAGMGMGDVKAAGVVGLHLGVLGAASAVTAGLAAVVLGGVGGLALAAVGRARRGTAVAFAPYLAAGALVALLAGPGLLVR